MTLAAIQRLKRCEASDKAGIAVEMLKDGNEVLLNVLLDMFNDIISQQIDFPASWQSTLIKVLFKKGDCTLPQNYRPIAIIQILHKMFSFMLYKRLVKFLQPMQSAEQAAYRSDFSTEDHLVRLSLLYEGARVWNINLWLVLVDFEKAFDSLERLALWNVLEEFGVPLGYIQLSQRMYSVERAKVSLYVESQELFSSTGVK